MDEYKRPVMEVVRFEEDDIIISSGCGTPSEELPEDTSGCNVKKL